MNVLTDHVCGRLHLKIILGEHDRQPILVVIANTIARMCAEIERLSRALLPFVRRHIRGEYVYARLRIVPARFVDHET